MIGENVKIVLGGTKAETRPYSQQHKYVQVGRGFLAKISRA